MFSTPRFADMRRRFHRWRRHKMLDDAALILLIALMLDGSVTPMMPAFHGDKRRAMPSPLFGASREQ